MKNVTPLIEEWLAQDIDEWTRRVVRRHFDAEHGSPYWLKRATELSFDPRDITRYEELSAFGPMPLGELRTMDPAELVPLAVPRPLVGRVWESGGTTGNPCRVFYTEPMLEQRAAWRRWVMEKEGFEPGRNWLQASPTGPHLMGHGAWDLVDLYDARVYAIDFDPRWVKRMLRGGRLAEAQEYTGHLVGQMTDLLETQPIDYLVTTPALLQALIKSRPELVAKLKGARLSGTHATPAMRRSFLEALNGGLLVVTYNNTFGNSVALPVTDDDVLPCVPNYPQVTMAVVDRNDWTSVVGFGEYGQVKLTVMHDDLFLPNILERDLAMRFDTGSEWPCDGVANARPLQTVRSSPEGVY
ncbi:arylcarboxylate reductase [Streptomyces sp. NK08204]|uniref:arylcarboxylate reductase n=1 Tax=Streptomyces sp. NK08204 TaxID=2873260 RepID=UPI001CECC421|nr:arylcarboxylate reductase [Streptomyces sp. NK08204]